eukprot:3408888-Alexandrium_andersonii.AAC.1
MQPNWSQRPSFSTFGTTTRPNIIFEFSTAACHASATNMHLEGAPGRGEKKRHCPHWLAHCSVGHTTACTDCVC